MPATKLPTSTRFIAPGVTVVYLLPAVVDTTLVPTRVEIDAGTDVTCEIADWAGWSKSTGEIATPDLCSTFTSSIPGRQTAEASSLTFYGDKGGEDIRQVVTEGSEWFVLFADGGDVTGQPSDVYPTRVGSVTPLRSIGDEPFKVRVDFSIIAPPAQGVALPATA